MLSICSRLTDIPPHVVSEKTDRAPSFLSGKIVHLQESAEKIPCSPKVLLLQLPEDAARRKKLQNRLETKSPRPALPTSLLRQGD